MGAIATENAAGSPGVKSPSDAPERAPTGRSRMRLFEPRSETLEDMVLETWEALSAGHRAECPVCGGSMSILAGCESCGSELS